MKNGKSGRLLNVYKNEYGQWDADILTAANHRYRKTFDTWRDAIDFANWTVSTHEVPPLLPTHTGHNFAVWKIRRGLNIRANRKGTIEITASKSCQAITVDESLILTKSALSAALAVGIWKGQNAF